MKIAVTKNGTYQGIEREEYTIFYGIPYAKAPVGEKRFCPPVPAEAFEGIRDCTCPKVRPWMVDPEPDRAVGKEFYFAKEYLHPFSEDSLQLHIWTPAKTTDTKLPVAVWIHGGGFQKGYGTEVETDGAGFCRRGVVFVSVEYRMGAFGFLCHPWLAKEQGGICGNYGILDQIEALKWVKQHIADFGGDPDKVTIVGQSAGAMSVQILASSPLTTGLFRGAVMQSGGGYESPLTIGTVQNAAEKIGEQFVEELGVKSLKELRQIPAETLCQAADAFRMKYQGKLLFTPVVDGWLLPGTLDEIIRNDQYADVPYLVGSNADDMCTEDLAKGMEKFASKAEELGRKPVWVYRFKQVPPANQEGMYQGSYHSAELWYVFETCERGSRPFGKTDNRLSKRMADCWCDFVTFGNPDPDGNRGWSAYKNEEDVFLFVEK